jgi:hypothetical protein
MIGAPTTRRCTAHSGVSGSSVGASAPVGAPALTLSDQATNRPTLTECRQVVGDIPLLTFRRQK